MKKMIVLGLIALSVSAMTVMGCAKKAPESAAPATSEAPATAAEASTANAAEAAPATH